MRDIKFRAWDPNDKRIVEWDELFDYIATNKGTQGLQGMLNRSMQFTGHQSIDGVDVYEGDLLNFPGTDDQHYLVKWLEETGQWGIMFGPKVFNMQMGTIGLAQFLQIAGNIYENKELING